ncbi:MAG: Gfo/Idh/MocA family oxidoreductase [Planctomycetota bacterium]
MDGHDAETRGARRRTRREVLREGAAAAAGLGLAPTVALGTGVPVGRRAAPVRIGVVGGNFGCAFQWHEHPDCVVAAVSDLRSDRRERLMQVYGCAKSCPSLEELIRDPALDAVAVFTGAPDHVRHCIAALRAGKHVLCAVPAALDLEEAEALLATVRATGLTYMMAETSYYRQVTISARRLQAAGRFGTIFYTEAEYHHAGLETLWFEADGAPTWRHGFPPMLYPTHCTAFLTGVTGERMTAATCLGWGDDSPLLAGNRYENPFWNETALFRTDRGHAFRVGVFWKGAHRGTERAQWYGDRLSFFAEHPNGLGPVIVRAGNQVEKDDAGFERQLSSFELYEQPRWFETDLLPEPLRHDSGHDGSHPFLTHEFVDALRSERRPAIDVVEALAYTVPGIVAHRSALAGGEQLAVPVYEL